MANASSTVEASKASQTSERRGLFHAVGLAVVIVAGAVAYRIATAEGDLDVVGGKEGLSVKIMRSQTQRTIESANEGLKAAQQQLAEAKQRLLIAKLRSVAPKPSFAIRSGASNSC